MMTLNNAKSARPRPPGEQETVEMIQDDLSGVYHQMDALDEDAVIRGLTGQQIDRMLYSLPFYQEGAPTDHKIPGCKYCREKRPHIHVNGVGIAGINEIARVYGGMWRAIVINEKFHRDGKYWWKATARAVDIVNFNMVERTIWQPAVIAAKSKSGKVDPRSEFAPTIAESKAIRNACRDLLPQAILEELKEWGAQGRAKFTEAQARELIEGFGGGSRWRVLQSYVMNNMAALSAFQERGGGLGGIPALGGQVSAEKKPDQSAACGPPASEPPPQNKVDPPKQQAQSKPKTEPKPEPAPDDESKQAEPPADEPGPTIDAKDRAKLFGMMKARGCDPEWVKEFFHQEYKSINDMPKKYFQESVVPEAHANDIAGCILIEHADDIGMEVDEVVRLKDEDFKGLTDKVKEIMKAKK
jgi:hypothetical protein